MNIRLHRMTPADRNITIDWITCQYGFERSVVIDWVDHLHFDWPLSVKAMEDGEVVGLLNMSAYRIEEETPQMKVEQPELLQHLNALKYTSVFSFIVCPRYRHTPLNQRMIMEIWTELVQRFDFVFVPVMHRLETHQYWKRRGACEFYRDRESVYYMLPLSEAALEVTRLL